MAYADTRIRSLETARLCATLGACPRTIGWVTGLPSHFILSKVFDAGHRAPRGRPPYTEDLVFKTTFKIQAELGSFAVKYRELTAAGFTPAASLVTAYQHYLSFTPVPSFSFDEAFFLVSNLDGIWACKTPSLQLEPCKACQARRLVAFGGAYTPACAFCKEESGERGVRKRVAGRTPAMAERIEVSESLPLQIEALRVDVELEQLGAHRRVRAAILSAYPDTPHRPPAALIRIGPRPARPALELRRTDAAARPVLARGRAVPEADIWGHWRRPRAHRDLSTSPGRVPPCGRALVRSLLRGRQPGGGPVGRRHAHARAGPV